MNQEQNNFNNTPQFSNNNNNNNNQFSPNYQPINNFTNQNNGYSEENNMFGQQQNKFINNDIIQGNTTLNDLNIDGQYNNMPRTDYSNDLKVQENLKPKKNTITITSEGKVFIIIFIVLLLFIFIMPYIFDMLR